MDMQKPGPDQDRLKTFVGVWRGREVMHPTPWAPEGGVRDAQITNRLGLDGFAILQDYEQAGDGGARYSGHAVILKAPHAPGYQMHWFDIFAPSLFEGDWDGVSGSFVSRSPMGFTRASFDFSEPGRYRFRMEASKDGKSWSPMMDGTYERLSA